MAKDDLSIAILLGSLASGCQNESKIPESKLNDERLVVALNNAINACSKIPAEQARYDQLLAELAVKRAHLVENNYPPVEIASLDDDVADTIYHRWLVEQQLNRAADAAIKRKAYLETLTSPELQQAEIEKCQDGIDGLLHWWNQWAWTADPRPDAPLMYVPFIPFDCQVDLIHWLWELVYLRRKDGHLDKSRDLGASWIASTFAAAGWLTATAENPFLCTFGSRKEIFVDQVGDPDTLLEKIRIALRLVPGWMLPKDFRFADHAPTLKIKNPATGSLIKGESANVNFARAGRQTLVVFDEFAAWPEGGFAAWTAASESARTRLAISTPQGKFNKFGELKDDSNIPHYSLWWHQHPWKTEAAYEIAKRRLSEVELAQEWDLDYEGSVAGRLLKMFSEVCSVITWSEFVKVFGPAAVGIDGQPRIPKGWKHRVAHDCGTTDDHPSVIIAAAMSPANSKLPKHLFFHTQIFHGEGAHPLILAPIIKEKLRTYIKEGDIEAWLISHEANAERMIYNDEFGLPFTQWDTEAGYTQGYPQTQHYFTPYPGENPFRPLIEGHPRAFIIVEDRQGMLLPNDDGRLVGEVEGRNNRLWKVAPPLNNEGGFKRTREELPRIHIPQSEAGKPVKAQRHFKKFDDAFDVVRAIMASLPTMVALTDDEKLQQRLRSEFKTQNIGETMAQDGYAAWYTYEEERHSIAEDLENVGQKSGREGLTGKPVQTWRDRR